MRKRLWGETGILEIFAFVVFFGDGAQTSECLRSTSLICVAMAELIPWKGADAFCRDLMQAFASLPVSRLCN